MISRGESVFDSRLFGTERKTLEKGAAKTPLGGGWGTNPILFVQNVPKNLTSEKVLCGSLTKMCTLTFR